MKLLYFTGSGNSLYVAKRIGGERLSIPQLIKDNIYEIEDDAVGVIAPTYMGEVPAMVKDYLKKAAFKTDYLFLIATYGNGAANVLEEANKLLKARKLDYAKTLLMVDNFIMTFDMDEEKAKIPEKNIEGQLEQIISDIDGRVRTEIKGKTPDRVLAGVEKARDPAMSSSLYERIYDLVRRIPAGKAATYGQIAFLLGIYRGARTVGFAMAACRDPSVPCHRVVNRFGGTCPAFDVWEKDTQKKLLLAEGVRFDEEGRVDLSVSGWDGTL